MKTILYVAKGHQMNLLDRGILFLDSYIQDRKISGSILTKQMRNEAATNHILHFWTFLCPTHKVVKQNHEREENKRNMKWVL